MFNNIFIYLMSSFISQSFKSLYKNITNAYLNLVTD